MIINSVAIKYWAIQTKGNWVTSLTSMESSVMQNQAN
eukprot:09494.XXX_112170_112280_1 [CDS] Oithona nana genome sequencing.